MIRVGPAGWSYTDWEGRVYPRHKPRNFHPLAYLARFVDCIEVNSTFYAQPRAEHSKRWAALVADHADFRFVVKLFQGFTHKPVPEDPAAWQAEADTFTRGVAPLLEARRLSAVLVQFPVTFQHGAREVRRLGRIRALVDVAPLVLEVRHQSWFTPPALDTIRGLGYSLAHIDMPPAWNHPPTWHAPTGHIGYVRLHGRNSREWFRRGASRDERYDYLYEEGEIREVVSKTTRIARESEETFVVTNNHFGGQAVANAIDVLALLKGAPVPAPRELVESFPHLAAITLVEGQGRLFG